MKKYIILMRPKHYLKNFLIFFPLIFSGLIFKNDNFILCLYGFIAFSLSASTIYIVNDIRDKEKDRNHEKKKNRPIASGRVSVSKAIILAFLLLVISYIFQFLAVGKIAHLSYLYILVYILINLAYSFGLKNIPLVDVTILVFGFLLRVLYGASIINVEVSNWLYLTVISSSFYLGLGKRRNEIKKSGAKSRKVLTYYNEEFLDKNMYMCLALSIVFYSLWCASHTKPMMIWTVPLVILLCMRYSMDVENDSFGDPVDVMYSDVFLMILAISVGMILFGIIYI